jgi:hypothetical protein
MSDTFFEVPRLTHVTSQGPVELPILYRDATAVVGMFPVRRPGAVALLEGTGLVPLALPFDRALAALAFYEYRDTTVGVYNEVGVAIMAVPAGEPAGLRRWADLARPPAQRRLGMYVVDLPVTTPVANAAGRELWGYPKFVTGLPLRLHGRCLDARVLDPDGGEICALAGRMGRGAPVPPLSLMTYTLLGGRLLRTHVDVRGGTTMRTAGALRLHLGESSHPMAARLRALGRDRARPAVVMVSEHTQSILHAGVAATAT